MKRDKIFLMFIVFTAFAVTGILHFIRSSEVQKRIVPYLSALESCLSVFDEDGCTNEFYSYNSQLNPGIASAVENAIPVGYFVEEQRIIEEFNIEMLNRPVLYSNVPTDYTSYYLSLTNAVDMKSDSPELKKEDKESLDLIIQAELRKAGIASNNRSIIHKIRANDSLYKLAKKYYNDESKWEKIYQANRNKMSDPDSLTIGQELLIPIGAVSVSI